MLVCRDLPCAVFAAIDAAVGHPLAWPVCLVKRYAGVLRKELCILVQRHNFTCFVSCYFWHARAGSNSQPYSCNLAAARLVLGRVRVHGRRSAILSGE